MNCSVMEANNTALEVEHSTGEISEEEYLGCRLLEDSLLEDEALSSGAGDLMACHDEAWSGLSRQPGCLPGGGGAIGVPVRVCDASKSEWLVEAK